MPELTFRPARREDLPTLIAMLANDQLGAFREDPQTPLAPAYERAFTVIEADPNNELIVACLDEAVIGMLQLTFIPYLSYLGSWRAMIESVRVEKNHRSAGIGKKLMQWAIQRARQRGCRIIQLTTNKSRLDAKRFYESLGFVASHEGMKLDLSTQ